MLDIGFSELLLIAIAALVFVGPKDLPVVLRHVMRIWRELREMMRGLKTQMDQVIEEVGVADFKRGATTIIDLEGKPQTAYNVTELETLIAPKPLSPTITPLPKSPAPTHE